MPKQLLFADHACYTLKGGIDLVAEVVKMTPRPIGRSAALGAAFDALSIAQIDEPQRSYQRIRCVLSNLTSAISDDPRSVRAWHDLQRSQAYLHGHCAECGCTLTDTDYAQIYAWECARVGPKGMESLEEQPICPACYARLRHALSAFAPA